MYKTNIVFELNSFKEKDLKEIGIFISYCHKDKDKFDEIINYLNGKVNVLSDLLIESGTENFIEKIKSMIFKSTCGVLIVNVELSPWVLFEIGMFVAQKKDIILYGEGKVPAILSHYKRVYSKDQLLNEVINKKLFSDLLENESPVLSIEDYNKEILNKLSYVNLKIYMRGLENLPKNSFEFSYIIPGIYKSEDVNVENKFICYKNGADLSDSGCTCYQKHGACPYSENAKSERNLSTVILNKIYNAATYNNEYVEYIIPVSKETGVTFKCFVDIKDFTIKETLINILYESGIISVNESNSGVSDRIYFTIPKKPLKGCFKNFNKAGFHNNYFCPGVLS